MKRKIIALISAVIVALAFAAPAMADPACTGALDDRPSSCFNAGPSEVGFHGPK